MPDQIEIVALSRDTAGIDRFLQMAYRIYDRDPYWVAPLLMDQKKVFTAANPLFQHAEMQLWVARRGNTDVGRLIGVRVSASQPL